MIVTIARETTALTEAHRNIINGRKAEYYRLIRDTLGELRERGDLQDGIDLAVAAHTIVGMIVWMPEWRRLDGRLSFPAIVDTVAAVVDEHAAQAGGNSPTLEDVLQAETWARARAIERAASAAGGVAE